MVYLTVLVVGGGQHMLHGISDCVSGGRRTACYMVYLTVLVVGGGEHGTWYI